VDKVHVRHPVVAGARERFTTHDDCSATPTSLLAAAFDTEVEETAREP
jgi:hypothetical protein